MTSLLSTLFCFKYYILLLENWRSKNYLSEIFLSSFFLNDFKYWVFTGAIPLILFQYTLDANIN